MKKIVFCMLMMVFLFMPMVDIHAQEKETSVSVSNKEQISQSSSGATEIEHTQGTSSYLLPFPGMLPDHFLYPIKLVRDAILERLISDPTRKIEFYVLQADKRLQMGTYLIGKGKDALGESTISKGEKYSIKAIEEMRGLKTTTPVPPYLLEKIEKSLTKHKEVIVDLMGKTSNPALKNGLQGSLDIIESNLLDVILLKKK